MRKLKAMFLVLMAVFLITACGKTETEKTTIQVKEDGSVEHTIVEDFDSTTDNGVDDLTQMILQKIADFNNETGEDNQITAETIEAAGDNAVRVVMTYPDVQTFHDFNTVDTDQQEVCFYGTIKEAYEAGYEFSDVTVHQASDTAKEISGDDILALGDNHIFIFDNALNAGEPVEIHLPKKINYCSEEVTLQDKVATVAAESGTLIYLITN